MTTLPDGSLIRANGAPEIYVIAQGQRRWIPDPVTFDIDGYNWNAVLILDAATVNAIPKGPDMPRYAFFYAEGTYTSSGGGHIAEAHCQLNLQTGEIDGYTVTTNYVQLTGYHSGTAPLCWNGIGPDAVPINPRNCIRYGVPARMFGDPPTTGVQPWTMNVGPDVASRTRNLTLQVTDSPDDLDAVLKKAGDIGNTVATFVGFAQAIAAFAGVFKGTPSTKSNPNATPKPAATKPA